MLLSPATARLLITCLTFSTDFINFFSLRRATISVVEHFADQIVDHTYCPRCSMMVFCCSKYSAFHSLIYSCVLLRCYCHNQKLCGKWFDWTIKIQSHESFADREPRLHREWHKSLNTAINVISMNLE